MRIIGIGFLSESSVALLENGKIKYAISQERLNRIKNWWCNPIETIKFVLKETGYKLKDIDYFATHGLTAYTKDIPNISYFRKKINIVKKSTLKNKIKNRQIKYLKMRFAHEIKANKRVFKNIEDLRKNFKNLHVYDHHDAHAASAYYYSGWKNCYVLTIDGWGDNASSKFYYAENGKVKY